MIQKSNGRFSLVILLALAMATGAVFTLIVGTIALQVGPFADQEATLARCLCDDALASEQEDAFARPVDPKDELRRAFLAALARAPRGDDIPAPPPDATMALELPPDATTAPGLLVDATQAPEHLAEGQDALEMPSAEEIIEQEEAEAASLDGELEQEPVDPEWAPATEQVTARAVAATESMYIEDVTCHESLCRVRVTHRDLAQRDEDVEKLLGTIPGGGQARVYAPPGESTTVMYFSREGKQLSLLTPGVQWIETPTDSTDAPPMPPPGQADQGEIPPPPEIAHVGR